MRNAVALSVLLLALASLVAAQSPAATPENNTAASPALPAGYNLSSINYSDPQIAMLREQLRILWGIDIYELNATGVVLVRGSHLTAAEEAAISYYKSNYPAMASGLTEMDDSASNIPALEKERRVVVLIGGSSQNYITQEFESRGWLSNETRGYYGQLVIRYGQIPNGPKLMALSDPRGFANAPRKAAVYSPLAAFVPQEQVPMCATGISLIMVILLTVGRQVFESVFTDVLGKERHHVSESKGIIFGIRLGEIAAFILAALILAVGVSWTFAGPTLEFFILFLINFIICVLAGLSHEFVHWVFSKMFGLKTEYEFWIGGAVLVLVSSVLGNTFGSPSLLIEDVTPEQRKSWKFGVMKLSGPVFTAGVMVFFALLNFAWPSVFFQMAYSVAAIICIIDILPFRSLDGEDVIRWNPFVWFFAFVGIAAAYILCVFIL
jgi:hypothetical protein